MFYGILGAMLVSLGDITYKKSIIVSGKKLSSYGYQFISWVVTLLISAIVYVFAIIYNFQVIPEIFSLKPLLIFFAVGVISVIGDFFLAYAFKNEKISILSPYEESETIFTVLFGFLFFSNTSLTSFIFVLLAGIILVLGSIDFKNFKFNRYAFIIMIGSLLFAIKSNLIAYLLISITPLDSLFYGNVFAFFIALILIFIKKEFSKSFKKTNNKILLFISTENIIRLFVGFVYAYLISEVGIVETTLLGLLTIFSNMALAYFVFKEVPEKKDYLIAFLVILCVVGGSML